MRKAKVLELKDGDRAELEKIARTRTAQAQVVMRARILLLKADGETVDAIAEKVMASGSRSAARWQAGKLLAYRRSRSALPACGSA